MGRGIVLTDAIRKGAIDFLEKPYRPQQLRERIGTAIRIDGDRRRKKAAQNDIDARFADLTDEERAVLVGIFEGKQNKIIAAELDVSLRTLQFRRASLMRKLPKMRHRTSPP